MARQAMSGWDDQFGYELVDESLELAYPESEPGVAAEIEQALVLARERQAALVMAMPAKYRNYIAQGGASNDDAFEFSDDGGDMGDEWAGGSGGSGFGGGQATGGGSNNGTQASRGGFANNGAGGSSQRSGSGSARVANPQATSNPLSSSASKGNGEFGFADQPNAASATGNSYLANGNSNTPDGSYFGSSGSASAGPLGGPSGTFSSRGSNSSYAGNDGAVNGAYGSGVGGTGGSDSSSATGDSSGGSIGPGGPAGALGGSSSTAPTNASGTGAASSNGMGSMASDAANDPTLPAGAVANQPAPSLNMDMTRPAPPQGNSQTYEPGSPQSDPVARQRGRNWAWSEGPPSKTAVVRSIRVVCYNDRWVMMQDGTTSAQVTIPIGRTPQASAEKLAKAIADRVSHWGIALGGGYWKPELVVDVAPDADARYAQLERLLEGSGLTVRRRTSK